MQQLWEIIDTADWFNVVLSLIGVAMIGLTIAGIVLNSTGVI